MDMNQKQRDEAFLLHITLERHAVISQIAMPRLLFLPDAVATRVTLSKSTLSKDGASYSSLHSAELI